MDSRCLYRNKLYLCIIEHAYTNNGDKVTEPLRVYLIALDDFILFSLSVQFLASCANVDIRTNMLQSLTPRKALLISIAAALLTMAIKTLAWYITGSVGFLSDAMESLVNLAGSAFALMMVSYAMRPADEGHPFGHGKAEYFSAAFEGGMIFIAALAILIAAINRLLNPIGLQAIGFGSVLSIVAGIINLLIARILLRVGRDNNSPALEADGRHLMTDVWTSVGVIAGVGVAALSGLYWLDPLVAIAVALHILYQGWGLLSSSAGGLMDKALEPEQIEQIEAVLRQFSSKGCRCANLRTRAAGATRFAMLEMRVPGDWSVERAHELADELELALQAIGIVAVTHIEPLSLEEAMPN
jgi:cation diffusion facilitator family transporter